MAAYKNGMRPKSELVRYRACWARLEPARALRWAIEQAEAEGAVVYVSEIYRFKGIPSDRPLGQAHPDYSRVSETSTQDGNQYFQKGREDEGFTPSAAEPGGSAHGDENIAAADITVVKGRAIFEKYMELAGFVRNIPSESWHYAWLNDPAVAIPPYEFDNDNDQMEEYIMATRQEVLDDFRTTFFTPVLTALENLLGTPEVQAQLMSQVNAQYEDVLGRPADPQGLFGWVQAMANGQMDLDAVRSSLVASPEYAGRWIGNLYRAEAGKGGLGREPGDSEVKFWMDIWAANGHNLDAIGQSIKGSQEYREKNPQG